MNYVFSLCCVLAVSANIPATGHPATERYIPIGESPGVATERLAGSISDRENNQIEVANQRIALTEATKIYLDRSRSGRTSVEGKPEDCAAGRYVEVKFREAGGQRVVEWVKVRAD